MNQILKKDEMELLFLRALWFQINETENFEVEVKRDGDVFLLMQLNDLSQWQTIHTGSYDHIRGYLEGRMHGIGL